MAGKILLSTAYFPPVEYFSLIRNADLVFIEREENYIKQTYRNRCRILASAGVMSLTVPVIKGDLLKARIKEVTIDYSKRWQQVHLRAIATAYGKSPYFQYYFEEIERGLLHSYRFLIDLNADLLDTCLRILNIRKCISYTNSFSQPEGNENDFRYRISPKIKPNHKQAEYIQVFGDGNFVPGLSILDLILNMGPESLTCI
jgi:WbqC-like protein family